MASVRKIRRFGRNLCHWRERRPHEDLGAVGGWSAWAASCLAGRSASGGGEGRVVLTYCPPFSALLDEL